MQDERWGTDYLLGAAIIKVSYLVLLEQGTPPLTGQAGWRRVSLSGSMRANGAVV